MSQTARAARPGRFPEALHAEWTKLRTLPGPGWLLAAAAALTIAVSAAADAASTCASAGCQADPAKLSLTGVQVGQAVVAIIAVLAISSEYSTGMIRVTLTAMPRRWSVLGAKAALRRRPVAGGGDARGARLVLAGRLILPGRGFTVAHGYTPLSLGEGPLLRAAVRVGPLPGADRAAGLGIATAVRDSAVAIGLVLALLYLFPIVSSVVGNQHWQRHLEQLGPMTAGLYIQATVGVKGPAAHPLAGPRRARRLGLRRPAARGPGTAPARRLNRGCA